MYYMIIILLRTNSVKITIVSDVLLTNFWGEEVTTKFKGKYTRNSLISVKSLSGGVLLLN
jgi:hypothetical protein